uniref:CSON006822 protein n=1 Tax=Culicoides sonorensis TaxID=179676 RepID=A0A336KDV2_CULSO
MATAILQGECGIIGSTDQNQSIVNPLSINGGIQYSENKMGNRERDKGYAESHECERESLLVPENPTPKLLKHKQLYSCINEQINQGGDSDTNSNCALIIEESNPTAFSSIGVGRRASYSIGTSQQPLESSLRPQQQQPTTSSAAGSMGTTKKTINGNNNYEMTDFDTKTPNYRRSNAPTVTRI